MSDDDPSRVQARCAAEQAGNSSRRGRHSDAWAELGLGTTLAASALVGLGLGHGLDRWLESWPWGTVAVTLLFMLAGLALLGKEARQ